MEDKPGFTLQIRTTSKIGNAIRGLAPLPALGFDTERDSAGIPWLHGEFPVMLAARMRLTLRIHNGAGIPMIEGQTIVEAGQRTFMFSDLRPLGIEAYAHVSEAEREQVTRRIWSRRAYGTLEIQPLST